MPHENADRDHLPPAFGVVDALDALQPLQLIVQLLRRTGVDQQAAVVEADDARCVV
jgi:hypothetical protein